MSDFVIRSDGGHPDWAAAIADRLRRYDRLVEVAVGDRPDVARILADRGHTVSVTDIRERSVPDGIRFVVDDLTQADPAIYAAADAVYGVNLPPELHRPGMLVARRAGAAFVFTTLGGDPPVVEARPETIPGDTLFWAHR